MKKFLLSILLLLNLSLPAIALASDIQNYQVAQLSLDTNFKPANSPNVVIEGGNEADYGNYFLQLIAGSLIYLAAPVAIIIIAVAGLMAVISSGDSGMVEKAKGTLKWAVVGLVIIIFSWIIISAVISLVFDSTPNDQAAGGDQTTEQSQQPGGQSDGGSTDDDPFDTPE
jgi:hypothetical protein